MALAHWVCFLFFIRELLMLWHPRLSVVFRRLVCLGNFTSCWRQANVTPIPKGPPSSSVANYRPIYITSVLSKVFERQVYVRLGRFMFVFQLSSLLFGKVWIPVIRFRACPIHFKVHYRVRRRLASRRLISVQHLIGSTIMAFSIGSALWVYIGGSVLSVLTPFLSNRSHHVMVDGCRNWFTLCQECRRAQFLGPLFFLLYTSELFFHSGK